MGSFDITLGRRTARAIGTLATLAGLATPASAQIHYDVSFQENESDGRLGIHGRDFDQLPAFRMVPDQRVFGRSFELSGNSLVQNDPGFTASDNDVEIDPVGLDAPVPNTNVHFRILSPPAMLAELGGRNLSYWDGSGSVSWGPVPGGEAIEISDSPSVFAIADGSTADVPGFVIDATDNEGGMHRHIDFQLLPDSGDDGVYLLMLEGTLDPYAEWVPFFLIFEGFAGGAPTVDLAVDDVESDLLFPLCSDGIDNDRDGNIDYPADAGCEDALDMSERGTSPECDNGLDDDMDGDVDFPNDASCGSAAGTTELPEPGTTSMLAAGAGLLGLIERRRRRTRCAA
ncbi:MAG: PEP-CTERM sorting domain-containing protein [Myxococcota bacterium]